MTTTNPSLTTDPQLPADLHLGEVHLVVRDLRRARAWYEQVLGLHAMGGDDTSARMGDGHTVALVLKADPAAQLPGAVAGLYHVALLYPDRRELARAALRLATLRTPIQGASDHHTHEAIYLADPDGNGLELAADRPRERWPTDLGYGGGPCPLDVGNLLATIDGETPTPAVGLGLRVGHLHLHVGDIDQAIGFYRDLLGLRLTANLGSAAFFAAGDYHHHLGVNVWRGRNVSAAPSHSVGLRHWSITLPSRAALTAVAERLQGAGHRVLMLDDAIVAADPWNMELRLQI